LAKQIEVSSLSSWQEKGVSDTVFPASEDRGLVVDAENVLLNRRNFTVDEGKVASDREPTDTGSVFPVNVSVNEKLKLVLSERSLLYTLDVDAIVNPTNERLTTSDFGLINYAGEDVLHECRSMSRGGMCQIGEAKISRAGHLYAKHIIHTIGPKYTEEYRTAAENALHCCYKSCLGLLKENKLRTIVFPCIYSKRKQYPRKDAAHIAIRTIRRFLEHHGSDLDAVVLYFEESEDMAIYRELLPLYCPRNKEEELAAKRLLPQNVGNEEGEPIIEDRVIRISGRIGKRKEKSEDNMEEPFKNEEGNNDGDNDDFAFEDTAKGVNEGDALEEPNQQAVKMYEDYLWRSKTEYLKDILALNVAYISGKDSLGRAILVIVAANLPVNHVNLDRVLVYLVRLCDSLIHSSNDESENEEHGYVIAYVNSGVTPENMPEVSWMKKMHKILFCTKKHREHMKDLYVVHPNIWLKGILFCLTPFVKASFWDHVHYVERLQDLGGARLRTLKADDILLPNITYKYDATLSRGGGFWSNLFDF